MFSFDIFCRVIDNYGDIGVCWRLAKQLAAPPHNYAVRLWVDDLHSFARIAPAVDPAATQQQQQNVTIHAWRADTLFPAPHQVVIEAFACELPEPYKTGIHPDTLWLNLEYLSAEPWVESFHGHASAQKESHNKFFFFPGFTEKTGGLLREHLLLDDQRQWLAQSELRQALLSTIGLQPEQITALLTGSHRQVFLFHYPNAPVGALLDALAENARPSIVLSPQPLSDTLLAKQNTQLQLHHCTFVSQEAFDQLLWCSDLNFVRGEDSLVRALWASRPMVWQPYQQADRLHLDKLRAWLALSPLSPSVQQLMLAWADSQTEAVYELARRCLAPADEDKWASEALQWHAQLAQQPDLCTRLLDFCTQKQQQR